MKKLQSLLTFILVTPIIASGPMALAEATSTTTNPPKTTTTVVDPEKDLLKMVEAEKAKVSQADRIKAYGTELKIKLTAADIARLKTKCVAAQGLVKALDTRVDNGITARSKAYDELLSNIDGLIVKLKAAKVSTTDLEAQRVVLKTKIDTFKTDLAKYKVALSDTHGLGCLADPSGFKASLEAARTARTTVATDALAIRTYVKETIKVTLKTIRENLAKTTNNTDTNSTTGGTQ